MLYCRRHIHVFLKTIEKSLLVQEAALPTSSSVVGFFQDSVRLKASHGKDFLWKFRQNCVIKSDLLFLTNNNYIYICLLNTLETGEIRRKLPSFLKNFNSLMSSVENITQVGSFYCINLACIKC